MAGTPLAPNKHTDDGEQRPIQGGIGKAELVRPGAQEHGEREKQNMVTSTCCQHGVPDSEGKTILRGWLQEPWPLPSLALHGKAQETEGIQAKWPICKSLRPQSIAQASDFVRLQIILDFGTSAWTERGVWGWTQAHT